jgi:hypothetical protein
VVKNQLVETEYKKLGLKLRTVSSRGYRSGGSQDARQPVVHLVIALRSVARSTAAVQCIESATN